MFCASSSVTTAQSTLAEELGIAQQRAVRGDDQRPRDAGESPRRAAQPPRPVLRHQRAARGRSAPPRAPSFPAPTWATIEQRRPPVVGHVLEPVEKEGEKLDRLSEPHVVGETGAETELRQRHQPVETARLVRAQRRQETARRRGQRLRTSAAQAVEQTRRTSPLAETETLKRHRLAPRPRAPPARLRAAGSCVLPGGHAPPQLVELACVSTAIHAPRKLHQRRLLPRRAPRSPRSVSVRSPTTPCQSTVAICSSDSNDSDDSVCTTPDTFDFLLPICMRMRNRRRPGASSGRPGRSPRSRPPRAPPPRRRGRPRRRRHRAPVGPVDVALRARGGAENRPAPLAPGPRAANLADRETPARRPRGCARGTIPHLRRRHQQARIVRRLEEKADHERRALDGLAFLVHGQLETEACPQPDGARPAPARSTAPDRATTERSAKPRTAKLRTGPASADCHRRSHGAPPRSATPGAPWLARTHGVDHRIDERAQERIRRPHLVRRQPYRVCRRRQTARQRRHLGRILARRQRRRPARLDPRLAPCAAARASAGARFTHRHERGHHPLTSHEIHRQLARHRPRRHRRRQRLELRRRHPSQQRHRREQR